MKLYTVFFLLLTLLAINSNAQEDFDKNNDYPNSILEFGAGVGANHGMYGFKAVLGNKGTGLFIGLGADQSQYASQLGVQASYQFFYFSMSYGVYGHYELLSETVLAKGIILMSGVKINLNQNKTFYLELGSGYGFGDTYRGGDGKFKDYNRVLYNVGVGVRIG